jgi:SEC-C motif-containing protein
MENSCPCGQQKTYETCCQKYHDGSAIPETAEKLMRARYAAFAKNQIDFIGSTHIPGTKDFDIDEARQWATNSHWKGLEILSTDQGTQAHQTGTVEFRALYSDQENKDYLHHEISTFKKLDGKWYYEDGQIVGTGPIQRSTPKVGRNEPCTCGSEKKFKKCCGA